MDYSILVVKIVSTLNSKISNGDAQGNGGYTKLPDGTLIQWGGINVAAGSFIATLNFYQPFINKNNLSLQLTPIQTGTDYNINWGSLTTTSAVIGRTPSTIANDYYWLAVGRWK